MQLTSSAGLALPDDRQKHTATQKLTLHRFAHCHSRREASGNPESRNWMLPTQSVGRLRGHDDDCAARVSDLGHIAIGGMPQAI